MLWNLAYGRFGHCSRFIEPVEYRIRLDTVVYMSRRLMLLCNQLWAGRKTQVQPIGGQTVRHYYGIEKVEVPLEVPGRC